MTGDEQQPDIPVTAIRLNFSRMRLPQEPDDQSQKKTKLTSYRHVTGTAFAFLQKR